MKTYFAPSALLPSGVADDVRIVVDDEGMIREVASSAPARGAEMLGGLVLPGMPNLHSHAFQRAMAGLAERAGPEGDSFWTWRDLMYRFVARLDPEDVEAIATRLYIEMAKAGFTSVAEFHYLHNDKSGVPYAARTEMSDRILAAAETAGIGLTLLPVLYRHSGFGGQAAVDGQKRFVLGVEDYRKLIEALAARRTGRALVRVGMAPHSLRAVTPEDLRAALDDIDTAMPVHIHIAEQTREIDDCIAWSGRRPVEWLLANATVNARWCLVHATHMTAEETRALAASGAVAGLCPTTEANLGDGLFPLADFLASGGNWGVGSDSNVSVSAVEELRWLEYGQRLFLRKRNVAASKPGRSVGTALWSAAASGGARALGQPVGAIAPGCRADLLVLDDDHQALTGRIGDRAIDSLVFAGNVNPVRDVMVAGRFVVQDGHHAEETRAKEAYRRAMARLIERI